MKTISDQLYGFAAEMEKTTETDGTTCFCVDDGHVYVAYGGIWYKQPGVYWKQGGTEETDTLGLIRSLPTPTDDLEVFNAVDTGERLISFAGHWFAQPIPFAQQAPSGGGGGGGSDLPDVTAEDNGDVLTVVDGAWGKAAPSGGGVIVIHEGENHTLPLTWQQIYDGLAQGVIYNMPQLSPDTGTGEYGVGMNQVLSAFFMPNGAGEDPTYVVGTNQDEYVAQSPDDYPSSDSDAGPQ